MKRDLHHIDDLFKAGLDGKEEQPDEKIWNAIENDLDKNSIIAIKKRYARLRRASVILLILFLGVSIYALKTVLDKNNVNASGRHEKAENVIGRIPAESQQGKNALTPGVLDGSTVRRSQPVDEAVNTDKTKGNVQIENMANEQKPPAPLNENSVINKTAPNIHDSFNKASGTTNKRSFQKPGDSEKADGNSNPGLAQTKSTAQRGPTNEKNASQQKLFGEVTTAGLNAGPQKTNVEPRQATADRANSNAGAEGIKERSFQIAQVDFLHQSRSVTAQPKLSQYNGLTDFIKSPVANFPVKNKQSNDLNLPRFSISPTASVNLMSNTIKENMGHAGRTGHEKNNIYNTENEKLSYTFSLLFDVRIANRFTIQSGIGYLTKTTEIKPKEIPAVRSADGKVKYQFDCSAGRYFLNPKYGTWPRIGDSANTITSANELHYINVPMSVKYYFGNYKLNFFATGGFDANILLGQDLTTGLYGASYYGKKTTPQPIGLNRIFVSGIIGGGINYSLNNRLAITFSPTYRFALNAINKDMPFKAYPHSLTLAGGLRVSLW